MMHVTPSVTDPLGDTNITQPMEFRMQMALKQLSCLHDCIYDHTIPLASVNILRIAMA